MNKKLIPTYLKNSIFDIDLNRLKELGYLYIFSDLDNTLSSPYEYDPSEKVMELVDKIKQLGLNFYVFSNNHEQRVKRYCKDLNVNYLYEIKKPSIKKVSSYLIDNNIDKSKAIVIGDQVMTDILMANKLNISSILVNRLTNKDEPITFVPRLIDKYCKKVINKKKLSKEF